MMLLKGLAKCQNHSHSWSERTQRGDFFSHPPLFVCVVVCVLVEVHCKEYLALNFSSSLTLLKQDIQLKIHHGWRK